MTIHIPFFRAVNVFRVFIIIYSFNLSSARSTVCKVQGAPTRPTAADDKMLEAGACRPSSNTQQEAHDNQPW